MLALVRPQTEPFLAHASEVCALCTDMGTEYSLTSVSVSMSEVAPQWFRASNLTACPMERDGGSNSEENGIIMERDGDTRTESDVDAQPHDRNTFLPHALPVPGVDHICSNLIQEVRTHLHGWTSFYAELKNLSALLARRWRRERFIQTCLADSSLASSAHTLEGWSATLYTPRWHYIVLFLKQLIPVMPLLQAFSARRFLADGDLGQEFGEAVFQFDAVAAETTVKDVYFLAYCRFAVHLDSVPERLATWSRGCPCHDFVRQLAPKRAADVMEAHFGKGRCPMQGMRAPEMATGRVCQLLADLMRETTSKILSDPALAIGLPADKAMELLEEGERATVHLQFQMALKLDIWNRLPWKLAGLAHWSPEVAQACARDVLHALEQHKPEAFDALTQPWCHEPLRETLKSRRNARLVDGVGFHILWGLFTVSLYAGEDLESLSREFQERVSSFLFVPVNEITIESKHAVASRAIRSMTNAGPVILSVANRWPLIDNLLADRAVGEETPLPHLLRAMDLVRTPKQAIRALGLEEHPLLKLAMANDKR
eukprot:6329440-Amphidinium_carterae.3